MSTIRVSFVPRLTVRSHGYPPALRRIACWTLVAVALLGAMLLARTGCERMIQAAPAGSIDSHGRVVAGYGWSLDPVGFTVRYRDGGSTTRLWW